MSSAFFAVAGRRWALRSFGDQYVQVSLVLEVARRHHDFALVGAAAVVSLDKKKMCDDCRLIFFSVGDGPVQAFQAEAVLRGQDPTPEAIAEAAETASKDDVDPNSDINATSDYRRHLVKVLGRRALTEAFERAGGAQ